MKVTVFGANGKVGQLVVNHALQNNFKVVGFAHNSSGLTSNENLKYVNGDVYNLSDVDQAIKGSEVVISALGSWGTSNKDILSEGMKNIIPTMEKYGINRIISLTGADAGINSDIDSPISKLTKIIFKLIAKKILIDGQNHIELLAKSKLDWTVIRSPVMNNKGNESNYELNLSKPLPWSTINRNSVAHSMVKLAINDDFINSAPYIRRT